MTSRITTTIGLAGSIVALFLGCAPRHGTRGDLAADRTGEAEAVRIGMDAYLYGYPLITMELSRRVATNVPEPILGKLAPMGQFATLRTYPSAEDRFVTAPNADTLYTLAWLDVSKEPWILGIPDTKGRYFLMPMLDGWTNVFQSPGTRTTGTAAQTYAITGPGWTGTLPAGVTEYKSPTGLVWILGRIYCTGTPADYEAVHELQDKFSLVPLTAYGHPYTPPRGASDPGVDMKTPVREQVHRLDAGAYFKLLATLMKDNPAAAADAPLVAQLAKIGFRPGSDFDIGRLDPAVVSGLQRVPTLAQEQLATEFKRTGVTIHGWRYSTTLGVYDSDYLRRAVTAAFFLGANRPQDAIYPISEFDADGRPYDGSQKYVMHFDKGEEPPVRGFWSLTMYDDQLFFAPNALDRYTLSSRTRFKRNRDGSVDLYLQHDRPGKSAEANWLPAPAGRFVLMLRLYWPNESPPSLLDGSWTIPPVRRVR
ncbi:MAG: DUF1254 domain-containing protein [Candidatus Binatia bacterium]